MIVDTHFAQLILTPECHPLLHAIHAVLSLEVSYSQHAALLAGELKQFHNPTLESEISNNSSSATKNANTKKRRFSSTPSLNENIGQYRLEVVSLFQ